MLDVIIYGATGYTGQLVAEYLATKKCKFGIAGRSLDKLAVVKTKLLEICKDAQVKVIYADSSDEKSLDDMVTKTKVVISTVGPFVLYGEPLGIIYISQDSQKLPWKSDTLCR